MAGIGSQRTVARAGLNPRLRAAAPFLPAVAAFAGLVAWAHFEGGYFGRIWYPSAIAAVLLLLATALGSGRALPEARLARTALLLLLGLVAWSALSMAWADSPASALEATSKLVLVAAVTWTLALLPWTPRSAAALLVAWSVAVATVCALSLTRALGASDLGPFFFKARYMDPVGYANGVTALATMASVPALLVACRKTTPAVLRALLLALAAFLLQFSLLPQSRGGLIALPVAALVLLAVAPDRLRLLLGMIVVGGAVAISIGPIYHVYDVGIGLSNRVLPPDERVAAALDSAARYILLGTAFAAVAGALLAALDRRVRPRPEMTRTLRRGAGAVVLTVVAAAMVVALVNAGSIQDSVSDRWETFKSGEDTPSAAGPRITANSSEQRYDYWRVAVEAFRDAPLTGVGSGNYGRLYDAERRYSKPSRYTHDVWLRTLAEGGIVGILLLLAFLGVALGGLARVRRRGKVDAALVAAGAIGISAYFFLHASFDWLEEFPALVVPAVALPVVGLAATRTEPSPRPTGGRARAAALGGIALAGLVLALLASQFLALRYYERAGRVGAADPTLAFDDLDRAADLNPLWVQPHLRAGTLAVRIEDPARARAAFSEALEVEPNWYAHLELGLLEAQAGRFRRASRQLELARRLSVNDEFVAAARRLVLARERIDPAQFNADIARRLGDLLG